MKLTITLALAISCCAAGFAAERSPAVYVHLTSGARVCVPNETASSMQQRIENERTRFDLAAFAAGNVWIDPEEVIAIENVWEGADACLGSQPEPNASP